METSPTYARTILVEVEETPGNIQRILIRPNYRISQVAHVDITIITVTI